MTLFLTIFELVDASLAAAQNAASVHGADLLTAASLTTSPRPAGRYTRWMQSLDDQTAAPLATESAVIFPVPDAERVVGAHRARFDPSAPWGIPAHVTVLYPFLAPDELDPAAIDRLAAAIASVPRFSSVFEEPGWFGTEVLWLRPSPAGPFRSLTKAVWQAFPAYPPYRGAHAEIQPHLTVAERPLATATDLHLVEEAVRPHLRFTQSFDRALLIAGSPRPRSWRTICQLPLGD